jgi:Tol biopolymer transport system component/tRNA A-37 threonylcarbamoyl transferase component Bud32
MELKPGSALGAYEIVSAIGKGGMGEVWKARDPKLARDVAIKVSAQQFNDRFEREARAIAALNHPNVCTLYHIGPNYLVMEYIEGATLAERITEGPIPLEEALNIAKQIADALEAAHDKGIVHRDLKPANVKIRPDGSVKVLDFGLAKAGEAREVTPDSPTMMPATQMGMILGTAGYMSPEQARGKEVDKRADIWAFGVVLYEMVTGKRLFEGETVSDTLAAVLTREPDWTHVPAKVQRLLRRCLEKDPKRRLRDISGAELLLEDVAPPAAASRGRLPWIAAAGVLAIALCVALWAPWHAQKPVDRPMTRLSVDLGPDAVRGARITAVLSPDGTRLVFTGRAEGGLLQLFTRRLDQAEAVPLAGTVAADTSYPFFSPDGMWIGFIANGKIRKVAAQGGSAIVLGDAPQIPMGASWGEDGNIFVGSVGGLMRIPAAGGVAQKVKGLEGVQKHPQVLPGAGAVLVNYYGENAAEDDIDIGVLQFETGRKKTLLHGGYFPRYLATSGKTGHLVYMHEGTLFGVAFDPKRLEIHGTPTPLLDDVAASNSVDIDGGGQFAFSETGTFVYLSERVQSDVYPILAMYASGKDASGKAAPLVAQTGVYGEPRFSPDGKRLAYHAPGGKGVDVWVYDLERNTPTQLTFTGPGDDELAWAPDSRHLVYGDGAALWWIRADGSGQPQKLLDRSSQPRPFSFSPDGRLAFPQDLGGSSGVPDIQTLPLDLSDPEHPKPGKAELFLSDSQTVNVDPAFSPDGKFLAYASSESGEEEVFVRPFPGPGGKWKISTARGKFPAWSRTDRELLFLGGDDRIMVADYTIQGDSFSAGKPRAWSPTQVRRTSVNQNFDLAPDGKRVAFFPRPAEPQSQGSLHATFLLNFFDEVRRRVPSL